MSIGQALRRAREGKGQRQADLGAMVFVSDKTISAYEGGTRRIPRQLTPALVQQLDDVHLAMEAANEVTGGMTAPALNGPRVDLHRVTTTAWVIEELREAFESLEGNRVILRARCPEELDDAGRAQVEATLLEMVEAVTAATNGVAVLCGTYGISAKALYRRHHQELAMKGYINRERGKKSA